MRSMALAGIELRFVITVDPTFGSLKAAGLMRRPFKSVSVAADPRPRSATVALPDENPLPPLTSVRALPDDIDKLLSNS